MSELIFQRALKIVFESEGGLSDHPEDDGGRTNLGITQGGLDAYRKNYFCSAFPKTVDALTRDQAAMIYYDMFWVSAHCDSMPAPLAIAVFDYAVNSGPRKAITRLQQSLGVETDGAFGTQTIAALAKAHVGDVLDRLMAIRFARWAADDDYKTFGTGWFRRGARLIRRISENQV